ncbi:MAG: hypothetical protein ACRDPH_04220 [Marmoricola sp.]
MSGGFTVDPAQVQHLATRLDSAGKALYGHRGDLDGQPDAGSSSQDVAHALLLAAGLAGLAQHTGAMSDAAHDTSMACADSDQDSTVRFPSR